MVLTSENTPEDSRSVAGGEKTACEAQAYTSRAPSRCRTLAALVMVPAVTDLRIRAAAAVVFPDWLWGLGDGGTERAAAAQWLPL